MMKIHKFCPHDTEDKVLDLYSVTLEGEPTFNKGKYYIIQIIHVHSNDTYTFYCCYGGPVHKFTHTIIYEPNLTKDEAIKKFKRKFEEKFGKSYDATDIDVNISYKGGYLIKNTVT